jgi:hypothetical protein
LAKRGGDISARLDTIEYVLTGVVAMLREIDGCLKQW